MVRRLTRPMVSILHQTRHPRGRDRVLGIEEGGSVTETLLDFAARIRRASGIEPPKTREEWKALLPRLLALRDEGHSKTEIARRMGLSKGAVIGKIDRLEHPRRQTPGSAKAARL
jgi:hypothetical protein